MKQLSAFVSFLLNAFMFVGLLFFGALVMGLALICGAFCEFCEQRKRVETEGSNYYPPRY